MSHNLTDLEAAAAWREAAKRVTLEAVNLAAFNPFERIADAIEALRTVNPAKAADLERAFVVFLDAQKAAYAAYAAADADAADAADAEARRTFTVFFDAFTTAALAGDRP